MKINKTQKRIIVAALFVLVIAMETAWVGVIYRKESKTFGKEIECFVEDAIINEEWNRKVPIYPGYTIHGKDTLTIVYDIDGKHFRLDTVTGLYHIFGNRRIYDFARTRWSIDSMASHFRRYNPYPGLSIAFTRRDATGRVMDCVPAGRRAQEGEPSLPPFQLGNVYADTLESRFRMPFAVFWQRQRTGLLLSCGLLLLTGAYGMLLSAKKRQERLLLDALDGQLAAAHDLKTPICSNRRLEEEVAARLAEGDTGQAAAGLESARRLSQQMAAEAQALNEHTDRQESASGTTGRFDLRALLESVVARHAAASGQHIALAFECSDPCITGNAFHIRHWAENLLDNAVRHGGGEGGITVRCRQASRGRIALSVSDRGKGIGRHERRRLFRPGFQASPSSGHSGWGLPYVRRTLRLYGGHIRIAPRQGGGTTCTVIFRPGKLPRPSKLPPFAYQWFTGLAVVAGGVWMAAGFAAERQEFLRRESQILAKAVDEANDAVFRWRVDTTGFRNDYAAQTVIVQRNFRETTVPMGDYTNQFDLYTRLLYDLRDDRWHTDSVEAWYRRLSENRCPLRLVRRDSTGQTIDRNSAGPGRIALPLRDTLPLGYVEGHRLEAQWTFPWGAALARQAGWIAASLATAALALWIGYLLSRHDRRQRAFARFQQGKAQGILHRVAEGLQETGKAEERMAEALARGETQGLAAQLQENTARYDRLLHRINYLLDQMTAWQRL